LQKLLTAFVASAVQHQHRKIRLEEHVFGGAAEHELAEPVAAVGAHDEQVGADIVGCTFDLRWRLFASRAHTIDLHVPVPEIPLEVSELRPKAILCAGADDDALGARESW
jgi:hypothetical protein